MAAQKFLRLWHRHLAPRGHPLPVLDLALRDGEWREDVGGEFPFPVSVPQDDLGFSFTATWRLHHEDLEELMPDLLDAFRGELRTYRGATNKDCAGVTHTE